MPDAAPPLRSRLRVVSINDVYTLENLPRMANLVRHHRSQDPADVTIVVLAGDFVAPSILSSLDAGRAMIECMNMIGVTHVILGNHEDDIPTEALRQRVRELHATVLGTNVHGFDPPLAASQVIEVGHVKVGLVGVVMDDEAVYRRMPFGATRIDPPNDAALAETARLFANEEVRSVIPITHQTIEADRALARAETSPPFPLIVGGHEHVVEIEHVGATWIVKAAADAAHAVVSDLAWTGDAAQPSVSVRLDDAAKYPEDPSIRARVDLHMQKVHDLETAPLVLLAPGVVVSSIGTRASQTTMGTLVCSHVRDALGAEGCIFNGGGIRGSREYRGRITYGDLKTEVPFDNEVVCVKIPGRVLLDAIAVSRAKAPAESGGFLQVDDRMTVDASGTLTRVAGAPLDPDREYRIATVRDLLLGMDHIDPLANHSKAHPEHVPPAGSGREIKMVLIDAFAIDLWRRLGGFDAVDANKDGVVTESEIAAAVARVTAEPPSPITAGLVMRALDVNHDHGVTREEADAATKKKTPVETT